MPKVSVLQFRGYTVNELTYKKCDMPISDGRLEIHPAFSHKVKQVQDNQYDLELCIQIAPAEEKPAPFELKVSMVGHFSYKEEEGCTDEVLKDQVLRQNTVAILFPYLRAIVSSLTMTANIPTLTLPTLNFTEEEASE